MEFPPVMVNYQETISGVVSDAGGLLAERF